MTEQTEQPEQTLFDALGGLPGVTALAEAWHQRVLADPIVEHAFSHGFDPHHTERLAAYWAEALGGPPLWTQQVGSDESAVVRLHSGNGDHPEMDAAAIACFDQALADVGAGLASRGCCTTTSPGRPPPR
ncbi:MAG: globin domain-containing protein [Jatrophihabitans sp.]|uniref:globin domain-containing protein n=1 Tax=Jatrophihabitans sp. TaxID=1932789 RepID=UPI003F7D1F80